MILFGPDVIQNTLYLIKAGNITLDLCEFAKPFQEQSKVIFVQVLLPFLATKKKIKTDVALKMWKKSKEPYALGFEYEKEVYKYITDKVLTECINFIPFLAYAECKKKVCILATGTMRDVSENLPSMFNFLGLNEDNLTMAEANEILIQLIYALYTLAKHKITHNDMHLSNILIERTKSPVTITIGRGPEKEPFMFQTKLVPKIFDWNLSYCDALGPNPFLNTFDLQKSGLNNAFVPGADFYQLLCEMGFLKRCEKFIEILKPILPPTIDPARLKILRSSDRDVFLGPEPKSKAEKIITYQTKEEFLKAFPDVTQKMSRNQRQRFYIGSGPVRIVSDKQGVYMPAGFACNFPFGTPQVMPSVKSLIEEDAWFLSLTKYIKV